MEQNACLGIYIAPGRVTVVLAARAGGRVELLEQFCIAVDSDQQQGFSFAQTAQAISTACNEKQLVFSDVAVSIDCRLYRQQVIHSEFSEPKQIAQTIKFDAEEAIAINAAESAVAFEIASKGLSGAEVSVFAVSGSVISEIILAMQNNKLDPVTIEPDSICIRRLIEQASVSDAETKPVYIALSQEKCFIVSPQQQGNAPVRAFLTDTVQNKTAMLAREIMLTAASSPAAGQAGKIIIYAPEGGVDTGVLNEQTNLTIETLDSAALIIAKNQQQDDCSGLDVLIAAGAAAGLLVKGTKVDFRPDFMPYQGKKTTLEKGVKILSVSLAVLFVALGIFGHLQYYRTNSYRNRLEDKFQKEYSLAMTGAKLKKTSEAVRKLQSEINRIKDVKSGLLSASGEDSIEAKLTFLLEAINGVPKNVDIDIDKIAVTTKTMTLTGSTSGRGYLQLFDAIDKHPKLAKSSEYYESKDGRDHFRLTIALEQ
ncbi:MAG: hypothetical protein A2173_11535 [Planctomycetes bacterium RBG_13_44_8b]|nr:MAG: hypothetical protein A2173_11535 [Planctomycetes bacterium RBG_13_44_8b]